MIGQISNFNQIASIRRYTITSGVSQGLNVIDCDNGKLRFILNESRCLDVMQLYHEGQNVSYVSKNGFTNKTCGFPYRFEGGMIYTCGFEGIGDVPGLEPHGTIHLQSADIYRLECNEKGLFIEANVYFTRLFGRNLILNRKIFTAINSETLSVEDTLINNGLSEQDYSLLYHVNVGYPMLDEGAKLIDDPIDIIGRTPLAEERMKDRTITGAPVPLDDETCFFLKLKTPKSTLINEKIGKKFTLEYSGDTLPYFIQWKSLRSEDYALGLEPATSYLDDHFAYRKINPQEEIKFNLHLSVNKI